MKKILLISLLLFSIDLISQSIPGVTKISNGANGLAFMFKDKQQRLWSGYGAMQFTGARQNNGLRFSRPSQPDSVIFNNGTFTDGLEWDSTIYLASSAGLYLWKNEILSQVTTPSNCNTLQVFKDSLFIGTSGNSLYVFKNGNMIKRRIRIQNRFFDTINDITSDGQSLWLATNSGLVQYKSGVFSLISTPVFSSTWPNYERQILAVEADGFGRIWFSNAARDLGINSFYVIDNSVVKSVLSYYNQYCELDMLLPFRIDHLTRARNGTLLLGTHWGLIEFGKDIKYFPIDADAFIDSMLTTNAAVKSNKHFYYAFENTDGHYIVGSSTGIFDIDRNVFSLEVFKQNILNTYKRNVSQIGINDIQASIANDGSWFNGGDLFRVFQNDPMMKFRSGSCANAMHSAGLWLGATIGGDTAEYVSAQTYKYSGSDYVPGPLNIITQAHDPALVAKYNKIWSVTKNDIDDFKANRTKAGYRIPDIILNWPANPEPNTVKSYAPYTDVDQDGKYDPLKGDYPRIKGDQMLWWVFNDAIKHSTKNAQALNFQINASCYAYNDLSSKPGDSNFLVNRTLIFEFMISNLSMNRYDDVYVGIMNDPDLGYYADDYVSCDTILNIGYAFNADNMDDLPKGFGKNPPIVACQFLDRDMHYFTGYNNSSDPISGNPSKASDYYKLMKGPVTRDLSRYKKPCEPLNGSDLPGDRRFMMSTKIGNLLPGTSFLFNFAYFLQYDPQKNYLNEDCNTLQENAQRIKNWFNNDNFPSKSYWSTNINSTELYALNIYPNPAQTILNIETKLAYSSAQIADMSGKIQITTDRKDQIDISDLSTGVYTIKLMTESGPVVKLFIKE
jgi:hypothetical protein